MRRGFTNSSTRNNKQTAKHSGKGQLRIIAGKWRGRKLAIPKLPGLRPTPDRIRETLFNWLSNEIVGARCLDLFCGSGALGFEAASRGAKAVTLVDVEPTVKSQIDANISMLNAENIDLIQANVMKMLDTPATPQDIVFIDPPFSKNFVAQTIIKLETNGWLKMKCFIYIETEANLVELATPKNWLLQREKKAGEVLSRLYLRNS